MKKKLLSLLLVAVVLLTSACGTAHPETVLSDGDTWVMGYASEEIVYPEEALLMAGYHTGWEIAGIHDAQCAHALWLEVGEKSILLLSVDCIGLLHGTVEDIRADLEDFCRETGCAAVEVFSTHTHAGVDTMGLWGEIGTDGKNVRFMENLREACVSAAEKAYRDRSSGSLWYGAVDTGDLQCDSRKPEVYDPMLYRIRFAPESAEQNEIWVVNYAAHAESLRGDNLLVSRDYPGVLYDTVKAETGADVFFLQGAIGGLIMTEIQSEAWEKGYFDAVRNMEATGECLADLALSIENERELMPSMALSVRSVSLPLDNTLFLYYRFLGILDAEVTDGPGETGYSLDTECGALVLDDLMLALIPGELFPECASGEGLAEDDPEALLRVAARYGYTDCLTVGLSNDSIGYILPPGEFLVDEELPYIVEAKDKNGEEHYEETNSVGPNTYELLSSAFSCALKAIEKS